MSTRMPELRIGISGWSYPSWRGRFYPPSLPPRRHLAFVSERMDSVEINATFYRLQKPHHFRSWYEETPPAFRFAVKGSRFITHNKKLRGAETPLANFFASGILLLKEKLGPFVWQLSERLRFDPDRMEGFLRLLPRDTLEAAALAARHDWRVAGRSWIEPAGRRRRLRHVIEFRHKSFLVPEFARLMRRYGAAIAFADSGSWPYIEEVTTDFVYLRLHGSPLTYASRYTDAALDRYAARIREWLDGGEAVDAMRITRGKLRRRSARDVYVYFDNDGHAHAAFDAVRLAERLR